MKTNNGYAVNHIEATIAFTKGFLKKASVFNSTEYNLFLQIKKDNPTYEISKKENSTKKETHSQLTFERMAFIIKQQPNGETALKEFENVRAYYAGLRASYGKVKAWFLKEYPNYNEYSNNEDDTNAERVSA